MPALRRHPRLARRFAALALVGLSHLAPPAGAQDPPEAATAKLRQFLDARPFHGPVFEQLYAAATLAGEREALRAELAGRVDSNPADHAARVLVARLDARGGKLAEAREWLAPLAPPTVELEALRGAIATRAGDAAEAVGCFERALTLASAAAPPRQVLEDVLDALARARLALGDREGAAAALREFGALAPEDLEHRLEAAARLSELGLDGDALAELTLAVELAHAADGPRKLRALVALADVHERLGDDTAADGALRDALALLAADHWRRAELFARRLALRRRAGDLEAFAEELRAVVEAEPGDEAAYVELAGALAALEPPDVTGANATLAEGARRLPRSLALARRNAEALAASGDAAAAVAELQRAAQEHPRAARLHLDAGLMLAAAGDIAGAATQWQLELELQPEARELRLEVAGLYARFGDRARAERMLRDLAASAPLDLRATRALVALTGSDAPLEAAERAARAAGDADALEELASEWVEREAWRRGGDALQAAIAAGGDEERLLGALLDIGELDLGEAARMAALLRHAALARDGATRVERIVRYVDVVLELGRTSTALGDESARAVESAVGPDDASRLGIRAHLLAAAGRHADAGAALDVLANNPAFTAETLRHRAFLAERRGALGEAVVQWSRLATSDRGRDRVEALGHAARLQRKSGAAAEAAATEDQLLGAAPRNTTLLRDLARRALGARELPRARDLFGRLLVLDPRDDEARLGLAQALLQASEPAAALDELCRVLVSDDAALRERARPLLQAALRSPDPELRPELARVEAERSTTQLERGFLWWGLLRSEQDALRAAQVLARLAARFPAAEVVRDAVRESYGETLASLVLPGARDAVSSGDDAEVLRAAGAVVRQGNDPAALRLLEGVPAARASQVLILDGAPRLAARVLGAALRSSPADPALLRRLAVAYAAAGEHRRAIEALETWLEAVAPSHAVGAHGARLELLELQERAGSRTGTRRACEALWSDLEVTRRKVADAATSTLALRLHEERVMTVAAHFRRLGLERDLVRLALATQPEDLAVTRVLLGEDAPILRPSELDRARARLDVRPYSVWNDATWSAARAELGAPRGAEERPRARWGSTRPALNGGR